MYRNRMSKKAFKNWLGSLESRGIVEICCCWPRRVGLYPCESRDAYFSLV